MQNRRKHGVVLLTQLGAHDFRVTSGLRGPGDEQGDMVHGRGSLRSDRVNDNFGAIAVLGGTVFAVFYVYGLPPSPIPPKLRES